MPGLGISQTQRRTPSRPPVTLTGGGGPAAPSGGAQAPDGPASSPMMAPASQQGFRQVDPMNMNGWFGTPGPQPMSSAPPSGGGGATGGGSTFNAEMYDPLVALQNRYKQYLDGLAGNSGQIMDQAGQRLRDAREGGRASLVQGEGIRGVGSSNRLAGYEAETQRGVQGAVANMANAREQMLGGALQGGVGVMGAPAELALREKGLSLQAAQLNEQSAMNNFQRFMSLLNAQRQSPIYSGFGASF